MTENTSGWNVVKGRSWAEIADERPTDYYARANAYIEAIGVVTRGVLVWAPIQKALHEQLQASLKAYDAVVALRLVADVMSTESALLLSVTVAHNNTCNALALAIRTLEKARLASEAR